MSCASSCQSLCAKIGVNLLFSGGKCKGDLFGLLYLLVLVGSCWSLVVYGVGFWLFRSGLRDVRDQ